MCVTYKGRFCILAKLILLSSFGRVLSRLEGTRLAATVPFIISINSIASHDTHRLKKADIRCSEVEWLARRRVGNSRRSLASVDARNELKHAKHDALHQKFK